MPPNLLRQPGSCAALVQVDIRDASTSITPALQLSCNVFRKESTSTSPKTSGRESWKAISLSLPPVNRLRRCGAASSKPKSAAETCGCWTSTYASAWQAPSTVFAAEETCEAEANWPVLRTLPGLR